MRKQTKEEFIAKANAKHNNKYSYDNVEYVNSTTKVMIVCPDHGVFYQEPRIHSYGIGCPKCKGFNISKALSGTTQNFIQKAKEIHGDVYDYSKVVYTGNKKNVTITCPVHGDFQQLPCNHVKKFGCIKCRNEKTALSQTLTKDQFVERAISLHGDKYDYSKVDYQKSKINVTIVCPKHGEFHQRPNYHLSNNGCPTCKSSKGELVLYEIFKKHNVRFIQQYTIPNITPKLRYDFYLPDLNLLIEFQGIQHYRPIDHFGGEEAYQDTKRRDTIKKAMAHESRIPLVEFNHEQLRLQELEFEQIVMTRIMNRRKG